MPISLLEKWLAIESISGNERMFLEALEHEFVEGKYNCERQYLSDNRWNLLITTEIPPRFLFSTHVDTVPPFLEIRKEKDRIFGRGACDTKGGIVAMVFAGQKLREKGMHDFGYLFVVGEEVDHCGAKKAPDLELDLERIILCEPTMNEVVSAQKGMIKLRISAKGIAAHSAYPERGESAIHKLLNFLEKLNKFSWPSHPLLGETTLNVGTIEGGVAANVFAPSAKAEVLIRTVSSVNVLVSEITKMGKDAEVSIDIPAKNDPVFFDPPEGFATRTVAFNTDASYLKEIAPIWLVGPGDIEDAHSVNEHISFQQLSAGIENYYALACQVLK